MPTNYPGRDWGVLLAAQDALLATGVFDDVHLPSLPPEYGFSASECAAAVLVPDDWQEPTHDWDDTGAVEHKGHAGLILLVRHPDPALAASLLDQLADAAHNAIDGQSLAGVTLPSWTRLTRGKWSPYSSPEIRMTCIFEWTYLIGTFAGHDTTDA